MMKVCIFDALSEVNIGILFYVLSLHEVKKVGSFPARFVTKMCSNLYNIRSILSYILSNNFHLQICIFLASSSCKFVVLFCFYSLRS